MTKTLADRIRYIIKKQNLTQAQFATELGVSANYISLIATGKKKNVSLTFAKLIESLYGFPADWLLNGKMNKNEDYTKNKLINRISKMPEEELIKLEQFMELYSNN